MNTTDANQEDSEAKHDKMQIQVVSSNTYVINIVPPKLYKNENSFDKESLHGRFGWITVDQKNHLPYIIRAGEKYCAVRMVEVKILAPYLDTINHDIYASCINIPSYYITDSERRLLNEINSFHCDHYFGKTIFSHTDLVVRLSDAVEFYKFLVLCHRKLFDVNVLSGKCGFMLIGSSSVVPYVVCDEKKYFPLFYFDGAEHLEANATVLKGWHLAYLKFCFKIQGIRDEYLKEEKCAVVSMSDVRECFPQDTVFKEFWPSSVAALRRFPVNKNNSKTWFRLSSFQGANRGSLTQTPSVASTQQC